MMLLSLGLVMAPAPVMADVSQPSVTVSPATISTNAKYVITFYNNLPLAIGETVSVKFPSGTTLPTSFVGETDVFLDGLINTGVTAGVAVAVNTTTRVVTITVATAAIASADKVTVTFDITGTNKVNTPASVGDYILSVNTSLETEYIESASYSIGIPGMVTRYNKDGNYVGSYNTIQAAINAAGDKDHIKLGPGTYTEVLTTATAPAGIDELVIESTGVASETIIKATTVTIERAYTTLDDLTIKGEITVSATDCTIKNSILSKKATSGETLLTSSGANFKVTDCTFDTTYKAVQDWGIKIAGGNDTAISGCTFTTDEGTTTLQDRGIEVTAAVTGLTVKDSTFNGTKGIGYKDALGAATITTATVKDSTFDGFENAFSYSNTTATSTLTIRGNTITNQTLSTVGAIDIDTAINTIIVGNTIRGSTGYSIHIAANQDKVTVIGNNFVDNAKGFKNVVATKMSAINNWWGSDSGPAGEGTGTGDKVSTYVTYKPYLTAAISAGQSAAATSLDAKTVAGVKVSDLATAATLIWASKYTANPKAVAPTYTALGDGWFDVYISGGTAPAGGITIKLYADDVTKDTDAYVWSGLENKWVKCSDQDASSSGGYVWVTVKTSATTPIYGDLSELPFVLVAAPAAAPPTFAVTSPKAGATDMPLTNIPFTWASVAEATSYELVLSANADLSDPIAEVTAAGTAYTYAETLTDGTPYYWQVTALKDTTVKGRSDVATFIAKVPVAAVAPEVTVTAPEITVEAPQVTVEAPPTEAPPTPGYIWAIIGIGAILVIAMIVLIVRTRRAV